MTGNKLDSAARGFAVVTLFFLSAYIAALLAHEITYWGQASDEQIALAWRSSLFGALIRTALWVVGRRLVQADSRRLPVQLFTTLLGTLCYLPAILLSSSSPWVLLNDLFCAGLLCQGWQKLTK